MLSRVYTALEKNPDAGVTLDIRVIIFKISPRIVRTSEILSRISSDPNPHTKIIAYDINREALSLAGKEEVADVAADAIDGRFSECDYIFLICAYTAPGRI